MLHEEIKEFTLIARDKEKTIVMVFASKAFQQNAIMALLASLKK